MNLRFFRSLLYSVNIHIWGMGLLSMLLMWEPVKKKPRPRPIELQMLSLHSLPVEGMTQAARNESQIGLKQTGAWVKRKQQKQAAHRGPIRKRKALRAPRVTYRFQVATQRSKQVRLAGGLTQAVGGWFPGRWTQVAASVASDQDRQTSQKKRAGHSGFQEKGEDRANKRVGGTTQPLLEIIQARIDAVTPLIHAASQGCRYETGVVRLLFMLNHAGYPCGYKIVRSSGRWCLDNEVDTILHMAEPYPYLAGWIPVTVKFTL